MGLTFKFLLGILTKEDQSNSKKHINEVLRYCFNLEVVVQIFNKQPQLVDLLCQCFDTLQEQRGLQLMKTFNSFIINNCFEGAHPQENKFTMETKTYILQKYFKEYLLEKIKLLKRNLTSFQRYGELFKTQMGKNQKKEKMNLFGFSLILHDEIFSSLINLLEEIVKQPQPRKPSFYEYIEQICLLFIDLMHVNVEDVKKHMDESYFRDFLQMILRALTFFGNLLLRDKEDIFKDQAQIKALAEKIKRKDDNKFVGVVLKLMSNIPIDIPKFKEECFTNVKNFAALYPEKFIEHLKELSNDRFFLNESKIYYDFDVVRSIYFSWISTIKVLLKNQGKFQNNFDILQYHALFENLCGILFDDNNHLNYVLKVLNYISTLMDFMMSNAQVQSDNYFYNFLSNIFQRLVEFLKQTKLDVLEIIQSLRQVKAKRKPQVSLKVISKLPRDQILSFVSAHSEELLEEELIGKEDILTRTDPSFLVQNTVVVDYERDNKLQDFLEEKVFKRLSNLNELLLKVFKHFTKFSLER